MYTMVNQMTLLRYMLEQVLKTDGNSTIHMNVGKDGAGSTSFKKVHLKEQLILMW